MKLVLVPTVWVRVFVSFCPFSFCCKQPFLLKRYSVVIAQSCNFMSALVLPKTSWHSLKTNILVFHFKTSPHFKISYRDVYLAVWSSWWSWVKSDSGKCFYTVQFVFPVGDAGSFTIVHASKTHEYVLCASSPHLPWIGSCRRGDLLLWVCVCGAGTEQIASPYQHNHMDNIFLISVCWLLLFFS